MGGQLKTVWVENGGSGYKIGLNRNFRAGDVFGLDIGGQAITRPEAIKDFYTHDVLVAMTKELTDQLRKNRTVDWQYRNDARTHMRMLVIRLLKKYKYPPEGLDAAMGTVLKQCEVWTDNAP